jgi:hypothetical protein
MAENVFLAEDNNYVITDFGRSFSGIMSGDVRALFQKDVHDLGVLILDLLMTRQRRIADTADFIPEIHPKFAGILTKCLAAAAASRPSVKELLGCDVWDATVSRGVKKAPTVGHKVNACANEVYKKMQKLFWRHYKTPEGVIHADLLVTAKGELKAYVKIEMRKASDGGTVVKVSKRHGTQQAADLAKQLILETIEKEE